MQIPELTLPVEKKHFSGYKVKAPGTNCSPATSFTADILFPYRLTVTISQ